MSEAVERIASPDGQQRVTFYRRPDGLFEVSVDQFYIDDLPEYQHHLEYWSPLSFGGLYDSLATAKAEALAKFPWIPEGRADNLP